jgi:hypothetical protein
VASSTSLWAAGSAPLLEAMKKAATVLRQAGVPFALAGGGAAYARGAAPPAHDVDFVLTEDDVGTAARALAASGMTIEYPPEGWLVKAFDGDQMIDLIFVLGGQPVTADLLGRAEEMEVAAIRLPVLDATDLVLSWLRAFSEHHADFAGTLTCVRPLREQVDWDAVRREAGPSAFARAFLVLLEGLAVIGEPGGPDDAPAHQAARIERALAEDPRTHELGIRVEAEGGLVRLTGEVAGGRRRSLIAEVARDTAPELPVRNEVSVTEVLPPAAHDEVLPPAGPEETRS